jgi:hypothetical protein
MKIKRPSVKGMKHVGYLGRFQKDKFIQDGHNTGPDKLLRPGDEDIFGVKIAGGGGGARSGARPSTSTTTPSAHETLRAMNDYAVRNQMKTRSNEYMLKSKTPEGYSRRAREMAKEMEKELGTRFDKDPGDTKSFDEWLKFSNVVDKLRKGGK